MTRPSDVSDRLVPEVEASGVRYIALQFTDVTGALKAVTIPVEELPDALEHGAWFDGSSVESSTRTAESDMYLVPEPSSFRVLPWTGDPPSTGRLICTAATPDGSRWPGDPRDALRRALEVAQQLGFDYRVGPEIEFFLLRRVVDRGLVPLTGDSRGYFDFSTDASVPLREAMADGLRRLGVGVNSLHHEVAAGQHEIDLRPADALRIADDVVTVRYALRAIARERGAIATFMPKPFHGLPGSGMHVHQSLWRDGTNAFYDDHDQYGLSDIAKHFIAGQLHHATAMCLVLAPLVNSYKRLVRGFEAPVFISWARTNRGALIRVPHVGRRASTRIELRSPDPSCNAYLAFAVMLRCGLDGVERRLPLPAPVEEALYGFDDVELERRNVGLLPDNLKDAIIAFESNALIRETLGDHLSERLLEAKVGEWADYRAQVTSWEIDRYAEDA